MFYLVKRARWKQWLAAVLLIGVFFFAIARPAKVRAPWYKQIVFTVTSPVSKFLTWSFDGLSDVWHRYFALVGVSKENERLRVDLARLNQEAIRLDELSGENRRLEGLLKIGLDNNLLLLGARVIANDPRAEFKTVTINRGYRDGIKKGLPVMGAGGLVGRIGEVGWNWSRVLLLTDPNSSIDVLVQRSRQRAILVGMARFAEIKRGYYLTKLEYLHRTSDIQDGDLVITSGMDGIFPKGLAVGTVQDVKKNEYGLFASAFVLPFEDMSNIEEVGVFVGGGEGIR